LSSPAIQKDNEEAVDNYGSYARKQTQKSGQATLKELPIGEKGPVGAGASVGKGEVDLTKNTAATRELLVKIQEQIEFSKNKQVLIANKLI